MSENNATPTIDRKQLADDITAIQKQVMAESSPQDDLRFFKEMEWWGRLCTIAGYATAWVLPNPISALLISQGIFTRWALVIHPVSHGGYDKVPGVPKCYTSNVSRRSRPVTGAYRPSGRGQPGGPIKGNHNDQETIIMATKYFITATALACALSGPANAEGPYHTTEESRELGKVFAECAGRYYALADHADALGISSGGKEFRGVAQGWEGAAFYIYAQWAGITNYKDITASYKQIEYDKFAAELEAQFQAPNDEALGEVLAHTNEQFIACKQNADLQTIIVDALWENHHSKGGR